MDTDSVICGIIPKNRREQIRISLRSFQELRMVDVRLFKAMDGSKYTSTSQGCAFRPEKLRDLIDALERAKTIARTEGLL